jgi:hypothetical protein
MTRIGYLAALGRAGAKPETGHSDGPASVRALQPPRRLHRAEPFGTAAGSHPAAAPVERYGGQGPAARGPHVLSLAAAEPSTSGAPAPQAGATTMPPGGGGVPETAPGSARAATAARPHAQMVGASERDERGAAAAREGPPVVAAPHLPGSPGDRLATPSPSALATAAARSELTSPALHPALGASRDGGTRSPRRQPRSDREGARGERVRIGTIDVTVLPAPAPAPVPATPHPRTARPAATPGGHGRPAPRWFGLGQM